MEELNFKVVKAGQKSIASKPELKCSTSPNHFVLNPVAVDLMDVRAGEGIVMLAMPSEDGDRRFFIAKGYDTDEAVAKLGTVGTSLHFNYAGIYSAIYMEDMKRSVVSLDELIDSGLYKEVITAGGNKAKRGTKTIKYTLEPVGEFDVEGVVREVYALTARKESLTSSEEELVEENAEIEA